MGKKFIPISSKMCGVCKKEFYRNGYIKIEGLTKENIEKLHGFYPGGIEWIRHYCQCSI